MGATSSTAQNPKGNPKGKADPKEKGPVKPTPPPPLKLTIVSKDKTVDPMVKSINTILNKAWKDNNIVQSRWADDYEFIRRASLDIIGRIATPAEINEYLRDPVDTRRSLLVDRLLSKPEYASHWADVWSNWLLTRAGPFGRGRYHAEMVDWLKEEFAQNRSYDRIVRGLLTATGKNNEEGKGAANFLLAHVGEPVPAVNRNEDGQFDMVPVTSRLTRLFLGIQVQCAQCHDHPFSPSIKQHHFWGINAFLRQVNRSPAMMPMGRQNTQIPLELSDNPAVNQKPRSPYEKRNGVIQFAKAEFLPVGEEKEGKRLPIGINGNQRRQELASYLIDHDNFSQAIANRMWGVFLGRGIVYPMDDFNEQNAPTNPDLLLELSSNFRNYGFDLHKLIRWITLSNAYNLSCVANSTNDKPELEGHFSRMLLKSMSPEQLFESMLVATNSAINDSTKDKQDARDRWLDRLVKNFGDDEGNEVNFNGTIVQALLMMNGEDINAAVARKDKGTVAVAFARNRNVDGVITDLFLVSLNRKPTVKELLTLKPDMKLIGIGPGGRPQLLPEKDVMAPFQDLLWALINSNEFILNH